MNIKSAKYITSVVDSKNILKDDVVEFAFVGRSNVGKSSLINNLTGQKNLAKTSSTPGLTKMINYFFINDLFRIVDLPGYGYAKTGHKHIANWAGLMEQYLVQSPNLKTVFVLIDCRHTPSDLDKMMLEFLNSYQIPYIVVATKVDKIAKSKISQACNMIAKELGVRKELVLGYSSENGYGRERMLEYIDSLL
ncbi:MAG: YihA family ribosome biogenesis GTP-binding protein [Clostridiales bacterium]|nr:YihA family ribosome biogenesis GTP-binding protein [Clostridiales bacterium]